MSTRAEILAQLQMASRSPFQEELAKVLACAPDEEAIRAWSRRNVDRWSQAVQILAKASGVADRLEVSATNLVELAIQVQTWSETQLVFREKEIELELQRIQERIDRATLPADVDAVVDADVDPDQ
jgi:hypothetical protein